MSDNTTNHNQKDIYETGAQGGASDQVVTYILTKVQKLVSALYVITSHFAPEEPLRASMRQKGIDLLDTTFGIKDKMYSDTALNIERVTSLAGETVSYVRVARDAHLLSDMNATILENEFVQFIATLRDITAGSRERALPESFFAVPKPEVVEGESARRESQSERESENNGSTRQLNEAPKKEEPKRDPENGRRMTKSKSKRREAILAVLERLKSPSMTDVAREVRGCSRKTIQRELTALMDEGLVAREGEKRWSRYMLVK